MAGVSTALSWQDVKEWMEKQEPYMLQTVLKTATNLLATHCNNSEQSAAEDAKPALKVGDGIRAVYADKAAQLKKYRPRHGDKQDDQEQNEEADMEYVEARAREWEETSNSHLSTGKKSESNKVALEDVNEALLEEYKTQERAIFGGDHSFHKIVSESLKEGEVREDILVAQRMLYKYRKNFFKEKMGEYNYRQEMKWFSNGSDDTHYFEVVPFQITKNHEEVMRLAASNRKINIFFLSDSSSDDIERMWGVFENDF